MNRRCFIATSLAAMAAMPIAGDALPMRRCAVLVATDASISEAEYERVCARIGGGLLRSGKYTLVDRARLSSVIREQGFSSSAYADPKTAAALGKIVGAQQMFHVTASLDMDQNDGPMVRSMSCSVSGTFEIVQVDTARIVANGTADGSGDKMAPASGSLSGLSAVRREAIDAFCDDLVGQVIA